MGVTVPPRSLNPGKAIAMAICPIICLFYDLARAFMHDVASGYAEAVRMHRNNWREFSLFKVFRFFREFFFMKRSSRHFFPLDIKEFLCIFCLFVSFKTFSFFILFSFNYGTSYWAAHSNRCYQNITLYPTSSVGLHSLRQDVWTRWLKEFTLHLIYRVEGCRIWRNP